VSSSTASCTRARPEISDRFLIVTADDFGLHEAVNEAVDQASRQGVLTAASLMVTAPAAADAVQRARALPELRVGLHLTLADGLPQLPQHEVSRLTDTRGRFDDRMALAGWRFFASPQVRGQLAREIRAQFAAFAATGLILDHVNAHKHFHLHPTVLGLIMRIGRDFGLEAVRLPAEPLWFAARHGGSAALAGQALLAPWVRLMKRRLAVAGLTYNDSIFGIAASGAMGEARVLEILARLPSGCTEVYLHPASRSGNAIAPTMARYAHQEELAALISPRVRAAVAAAGVARGGFRDAASARRAA
jgi:chitin disaccharide deacetylase